MAQTSTAEPTAGHGWAFVSLPKDKQIAVYQIGPTGLLSEKHRISIAGSPGAMCVDQGATRLYVVMQGSKSIAAFKIESNAQLTPINEIEVGAKASFLTLHPKGKFLLSSYYTAGQVAVHGIDDDGAISATPVELLQTDQRAHCVSLDPTGKFVFVCHTLPNSIHQFRFDETTGKLTANSTPKLQREMNTGPRHLFVHPTNGFAYGSDEQGSSVTAYRLNAESGDLEVAQTISSLPADGAAGKNTTSDIEVHPSGKFVFTANRGNNTIASYSIDDTSGKLSLLQHTPTEPLNRSFNISPDGKALIAAGQRSGNLAVFRIDDRGSLERVQTIEAGKSAWWVQTVHQ